MKKIFGGREKKNTNNSKEKKEDDTRTAILQARIHELQLENRELKTSVDTLKMDKQRLAAIVAERQKQSRLVLESFEGNLVDILMD